MRQGLGRGSPGAGPRACGVALPGLILAGQSRRLEGRLQPGLSKQAGLPPSSTEEARLRRPVRLLRLTTQMHT